MPSSQRGTPISEGTHGYGTNRLTSKWSRRAERSMRPCRRSARLIWTVRRIRQTTGQFLPRPSFKLTPSPILSNPDSLCDATWEAVYGELTSGRCSPTREWSRRAKRSCGARLIRNVRRLNYRPIGWTCCSSQAASSSLVRCLAARSNMSRSCSSTVP